MSYKQLALGRSLSRQPTCKQKSNAYTCRNVVERKLFNLYSFCIKFSFLLVLTHLQRLCQRTELLAKLFHILFTWLHRHKLTVRGKKWNFFLLQKMVYFALSVQINEVPNSVPQSRHRLVVADPSPQSPFIVICNSQVVLNYKS